MSKYIIFAWIAFLVSQVSLANMDATVCATAVVTNLKTQNVEIAGTNQAQLITMWTQICQALIDHIKNNAVVTVTGVQTGGSSASGTVH